MNSTARTYQSEAAKNVNVRNVCTSAEFAMSMEDLVLTKSFLLGTLSDNQALVENFRVSYAGETVGEGGYEVCTKLMCA